MVGPGAELRSSIASPTTEVLAAAAALHASMVHRDDEDDDPVPALPNFASVKVPEVFVPDSPIAHVGVRVDGMAAGRTETIVPVAELARRRLDSQMRDIMVRAVLRRIVKEASVAATAKALGLEGTAAAVYQSAVTTAWAAAERPDLRCWSFLPRDIQILRIELPAGDHAVEFASLDGFGRPIAPLQTQPVPVSIEDGRNHYRVVFAMTSEPRVVPPRDR